MTPSPANFKERFCRVLRCSDTDFANRALQAFFHRPWAWLTPILVRLFPSLLRTDIAIVEQLGRVSNAVNLAAEVRDLRMDYLRQRDYGLARRSLRFRLSGQRIIKLSRQMWNGRES